MQSCRKGKGMVTIKDIAQATGVSCTTVSNVIHGREKRVSAETVNRIREAIQTLGYVPNMSARSLVSNSSKVIGFINHVIVRPDTHFMEDPFHSSIISSIEYNLRESGYYLMLRTVKTPEDLMAFLQNWSIDGLFITGIFKDSFYDALSTLSIPIVLIDSYVRQPNVCNIGLEDFKGSYNATRYLIDHGHRRIAFASPNIKDGGVLQERFLGYKAALNDASIPFDQNLIIEHEMDLESCSLSGDRLFQMPDVTGLIVTADYMAAGIIAVLRERGIRVPEDISVIGFDDISISQLTSPPLTTIHQDMYTKSRLAVETMLKLLEGTPVTQTEITLPTRLVERASVRTIS